MDSLIERVFNIEMYVRDFMGVDLARLEGIRHHPERVISLDSDDEEAPDTAVGD